LEFTNLKRSSKGDYDHFELNDPDFSIFSYEKEILIMDGLGFVVI
jgi:hypothetical protein